MATEAAVLHVTSHSRLSAEDFETASIRSAAPSYVSEAPSYHTLPPPEAVPPYTPRAPNSSTTSAQRPVTTSRQSSSMLPPMIEPRSTFSPGAGLPPLPRRLDMSSAPSLSQFHIAPWSSISNGNPQVRHYQSVANRRVAAASAPPYAARPSSPSSSALEGALRAALGRIHANMNANTSSSALSSEEDDDGRLRPLEDPDLVGEEAAADARRERLARKHGEDVLILEDRRWDFWLEQMRDIDQRERSWNAFRSNLENRSTRRKLTRRFGR
ncbi:hypothetical protein F5Y17DRAFT_456857 [Xylariaceae sp. FL0594]|nr:hypothetical protein F5Y17DRAFT_456857 [Xylariaceae sp. FL0594]